MNFSSSLRERVVAEALSRSQTQGEIAEQFGVGRSTVQNWLRQSRKNGSKMDSKTKKPQSWSREQRLEALLETHQLSEEALGKWCREHGLHTHHLVQWRKELTKDTSSMDHETRSLRQENRDLKKELRRKEKALAETAALLVLKKKSGVDLGGARGRLITAEDRKQVLVLVAEAVHNGCRKKKACEALGLSLRTVQRWERGGAWLPMRSAKRKKRKSCRS